MRVCAALAFSVGVSLALAPGAGATTYCPSPGAEPPGCSFTSSPQQALNEAAAHPGFDTVVLGAMTYDVGAGLVYSDGGSADNGIRIDSQTDCPDRYSCTSSRLRGGAPGTVLLSLSAPGGSDVSIVGVRLEADGGATGLVLGSGVRAQGVSVSSAGVGVRLEGTASAPALFEGLSAYGAPAVDAPGHGIMQNSWISGLVGVRVRGDGDVDIRGGSIDATTAVTGTRARITGTAVTFGGQYSPTPSGERLGVEAICADAASGDAAIEITNATIFVIHDGAGATGVRAAARGGDGESCDASVSLSSTIVWGADHSLDARGDPGSGTDPRDGTARISAAYSDFSAAATMQTAPAELDTSSPGGNIDTDPQFYDRGNIPDYQLLWSSPLIDAGDPAPPEEWQQPFIPVVHGRRDIGEDEYGFARPTVQPGVYPGPVATGAEVNIVSGVSDSDLGDDLDVVWTLPDGATASGGVLTRRYDTTGFYAFHVKATDPTGQFAEGDTVVHVVRQRLSGLGVRPVRFDRVPKSVYRTPSWIRFTARGGDTIDFRVHRATHPRGRSRIRWKRVSGGFHYLAFPGDGNLVPFPTRLARRLRPGLYRLTADPRGEGTGARTRFRIVG